MPATDKTIYLTFDDGPHPQATVFALDELKKFEATATFFCLGKNVAEYPEVYARIVGEGHAIGNHTFNHLNGWKNKDDLYVNNVKIAAKYIDSNLFRPPYGRITRSQQKLLAGSPHKFSIVMWTVLSGDFDNAITADKCLENVIGAAGNGSIVVFHDNEKAREKMSYALPKLLEYFCEKGYRFKRIDL